MPLTIEHVKKVWEYVDNILKEFRSCFSREDTFKWFIIVVVGFMLRSDHLGVTSIMRELELGSNSLYTCILHFFHSTAWTLPMLQEKWLEIIQRSGTLYLEFEKPIIIGDGIKKPKEGKRIPGVKKTHQESGNSSKVTYAMAHLFGALGVVAGNGLKQFCLPISMTIQDGCQPILEWIESKYANDSHVTCLVRQGCEAAARMHQECFLILDSYFLSEPALTAMSEEAKKAGKAFVTLITKAKSNYTALEKPEKDSKKKVGKKVKLFELFTKKAEAFTVTQLSLYGKTQEIRYYCVNLLWGRNLKQELRFVLTVMNDDWKSIIVCTDLNLHPEQIIKLYAIRFKIEVLFRAFNQCISGLNYHFWNKHVPRLNPFETAKATAEKLAMITDIQIRESIISTYRAIEGYVMFCCIAIGILQLCALNFTQTINASPIRWMRTYTNDVPSENSTQVCMRNSFIKIYNKCHELGIVKIISEKRALIKSTLGKPG